MTDKQTIELLTEALEFYARHHWYPRDVVTEDGRKCRTYDPPFSVRNDHGESARQTLAMIEASRENERAAQSQTAIKYEGGVEGVAGGLDEES